MTINDLLTKLTTNNYLTDQLLALPSINVLGSNQISNLLSNTTFYLNSILKLTRSDHGNPIVNDTIVLNGTFEQSFLGQANPSSTVVFFIDENDTPQMYQIVNLPVAWKFSNTFSKLAGTRIDSFKFDQPAFALASVATDLPVVAPLAAGLNFAGELLISSPPLSNIAWLWGTTTELDLSGSVTLASGTDGVPTMSLATPSVPTDIKIGAVTFAAGIATTSKPSGQEDGPAKVDLSLTAQLSVGSKSIPITATLPDGDDIINLAMGDTRQPLATLNDLAALANTASLTNLIPSQFPLGNNLALVSLSLSIDPASKTVFNLGFGVGLVNMQWTIVPPSIVVFNSIVFDFSVPFLTQSVIVLTINAAFTILSESQQRLLPASVEAADDSSGAVISLSAQINLSSKSPNVIFAGFLASGSIDVIDAVRQFFGATTRFDKTLKITQLNFQINPSDKTYLLNGTVDTSDILTIPLGPDLPGASNKITITSITLNLQRQQTSTSVLVSGNVLFLTKQWTLSAARPGTGQGWTFTGMLAPNQTLTIGDVINGLLPPTWGVKPPDPANLPAITAFQASFNTASSTFSVQGGLKWSITIIENKLIFNLNANISLKSTRSKPEEKPQYSGLIAGDVALNDIKLIAQYAFQPGGSQLTFVFAGIKAVYKSDPANPSLTISFGNKSLGEILSFLIGLAEPGGNAKLPAPWSALNSVSLNGLQIQIFFKTGSIKVTYPIKLDLGFIKINLIGFEYKRLYGKGDVQIILDADFLGQSYSGNNALQWNPATQSPPALPGAGAAAFDLQYLGLGQHVSLRANDSSLNTIDGVINALRSAVRPINDPSSNPVSQLPGIQFNSSSNWLIGAQFSVAGVFSMSLVFNDPNVYGLVIGLSGEKAGPLAGLRFEILYRKITDKIGLYHIDLKLPDAFRRLQFGQVSITLPIITVDIYTNGDFRVDFGFPTSMTNTSRCFAVEVFPFVGVGGFYFAKLSGDTSTSVPKIDNGRFNPVIEAGIALFVGVGKSISLGVLSGGISITVNGIIQGVYAYFEPTDHNLPSATFFRLTGTIAIVGQVYATLDFGIIQASVSLTVYASVSLTFQVYEPIYIQVSAGVDVSVSIKIIFIRIKFTFRATITASFVIGNKSTPPWRVVSDGGSGRQRLSQSGGSQIHPLLAMARMAPQLRMLREPRPLAMSTDLLDETPVTIELMFTPLITKALDTDFPPPNVQPSADGQAKVVVSAMLFIGTSIAPDAGTPLQASVVTGDGSLAGFNVLLMRLLKWAVNNIAQETDIVQSSELEQIYKDLTKDTAFDQYFGYSNLSAFFTNSNITFQLNARPTSGDPVSAAFFPMIPSLALSTPNYSFDFGQELKVSSEYEDAVKRYFQDLAVDYANSVERNPDGEPQESPVRAGAEPDDANETMATFVFRRYFLMLAQSVVQSAIDFLKDYTYKIQSPGTESLASIARQFPTVIVIYTTRLGDTLDSIVAQFNVGAQAIVDENPGVDFNKLTPGTEIRIPVNVTVEDIVTANRSSQGLLRQWPSSGASGDSPQRPILAGIQYQVVDGDMLGGADPQHSISTRFGLTASDVAQSNLDNDGLFRPGASVVIGDLNYTSRNGDTLQSIAKYFGVSLDDLLSWNQPIPLLADGKQSLIIQIAGGDTYIVGTNDSVQSVAQKFQISVDDILRVNLSIRVAAGVSITLKGISHTSAGTFVANYMTTDGDTLDGMITRYFGFVDDALRDLFKKWNPTVDFTPPLAPATLIEFPLSESLFHLQTYYAVTLATLLQSANVTNNRLLAPLATLEIPDIAPGITATDSFESLATRYAVPLDELAGELAQIEGIFRDAIDNENPSLIIPFVPAISIEQLLTELGGSDKMNQSAMMTSRFMLQGLRVPPPSIQNNLTYPVFALIGQEFPAPAPENAPGYTFTVKQGTAPGEEVPWVSLPSESGHSPAGTLTFELSAEEQAQIGDFQNTVLKPGVELCRRLPLSAYSASQHALEVQYVWQAGELPAASCFTANGQLTGQPTLLPFPGDLKTAVADISRNGAPYKLVVAQPKPTGGTEFADARCYCWATMVDLTVSRVAVQGGDSPFLADTFLMLGATQTGKELLFDILNYLSGMTGEEVSLFLLLPPSQSRSGSGGYVSTALDRAQSVLLMTNLSTLSHSGQMAAADVEQVSTDPQERYSATLEASHSKEFLRLLWQCSVVKSGGFYLTYHDTSGHSLPDWLFAENNQGSISLLILLKSQLQSPQSLIRTFNNVAVLGDNVDMSNSHLFARALAPIVGKSNVQGGIAQTLQDIANQYPQVAATPASLAAANKSIQNLLRTGASVAILNQPDYAVVPNDTFASIAAANNITDVSLLGSWNAQRDILQPAAIMQLIDGQLLINAKLPPGNTGFLLTRENPEVTNPGADRAIGAPDPQQEINNLFNLLGFWITENDFFNGSGEGLPAGPTQSQHEGTDGLSARQLSEADSEPWRYTQSLKAYASAKANTAPNCAALPPIGMNPYAGVVAGSKIELSLAFQDLNGNRLTTDPPLESPDVDIGYTDELLSFARWPSVSAGYVFKKADFRGTSPQAVNLAQLVAEWTFSCVKYMPGPGNDYPQSHNSARADREKMKAAYYQIRMPDVGFALSTTMGPVLDDSTETTSTKLLLALRDFVSSAYVYLATVAELPPVTHKTGQAPPNTDTLNSIASLYSTVPGLVADANADLNAVNLFGTGSPLTVPEYYRFKTGDTFDAILTALLPKGTPEQRERLLELMAASNENTPMRAGTAILAKLRQVTVNNSDSKLSTVSAISSNFFVSIVDTTTGPADDLKILVPGLASANKIKVLNKGTVLTLGGVSLAVGDLETLAQITTRFVTEGVEDATVEAVAVQNQFVQPFFAGNVVLDLPDYVLQPGDTLLSVADTIGPVDAAGDDQPVIELLKDNVLVPDLYPPGTMLFYGTTNHNIAPGETLKSIADQYGITIQDLGTRNAVAPLQADQSLRIPYLVDASELIYSTYCATGSETFADIASVFSPAWSSVTDLAEFNRYVPSLFNPNQSIEIGGKQKKPALDDTFDSLATFFGMQNDFNAFALKMGPMPGVVRPLATLYAVTMKVADGETLSDAAARYHATPAELADANASVYKLLQSDQTVTVAGYTASVLPGDTFAILAAQINAMREANNESPGVSAADVGAANPTVKLQASNLVPPVRGASVAAATEASFNAAIRPVQVTLAMTRDYALVDPEFKASKPVYSITTTVGAQPLENANDDSADPLLSLRSFATDFEEAFVGLKLATGADQNYLGDAQRAACGQADLLLDQAGLEDSTGDPSTYRQLWAVNFGTDGDADKRFNYRVLRDQALFYSLPPLSTELWDSGELTLQSYVSGQGLTGEVKRQIKAADVDQWAMNFLAAVDKFLAPAYASRVYELDKANGTKYFSDVVTNKGDLASHIKEEIETILEPAGGDAPDVSSGIGEAKDAFYQQLLIELSAAYATDVLVQYPFDVTAGCPGTGNASVAARLSGKPMARAYRTPEEGIINLPEIALTLTGTENVEYVAVVLQNIKYIISTGIDVRYTDPRTSASQTLTTDNNTTLSTIAAAFKVDVAALADGLEVMTLGKGLFRLNTSINVTAIKQEMSAGDLFSTIATKLSTTVESIMFANQNLPNVFQPGSTIELKGISKAVPPDGKPLSVALEFYPRQPGGNLDSLKRFALDLWSGELNATAKYQLGSNPGPVLTLLVLPPVYTFTTGKVPLAQGTRFATFLFDVKDASHSRSVFLDLDYAISEMEYDIVSRASEFGQYQESSWLTFILPITEGFNVGITAQGETDRSRAVEIDNGTPNDEYLGLAQIPVPLRAYPEAFVVSAQSATTESDAANNLAEAESSDDVSLLFEWIYQFDMSRRMAAQDSADLAIYLNVTDGGGTMARALGRNRDLLFSQLAQFVFVYSEVAKDLDLLLRSNLTPDEQKTAECAVKTFWTLVDKVSRAWPPPPTAQDVTAGPEPYKFHVETIVSESDPSKFGFLLLSFVSGPEDFLFSLPGSDAQFLDSGQIEKVKPAFASEGYALSTGATIKPVTPKQQWLIIDDDNQLTFQLDLNGSVIDVNRKFLWPAISDVSGSEPVELAARQIGSTMLYDYDHLIDDPARLLMQFKRLNVITKQNGWGGASVARNALLIPGRQTQKDFIYQTPMTFFANKVTPNIRVDKEISLRLFADAKLADALGGYFEKLFAAQAAADPSSIRQLRVSVRYGFQVATGERAESRPGPQAWLEDPQQIVAGFPLILIPQYGFKVGTDGNTDPTSQSFVVLLASQTQTARQSAGAPGDRGRYYYDVTVYSTLGGDTGQSPLIEFDALYYDLPEPSGSSG